MAEAKGSRRTYYSEVDYAADLVHSPDPAHRRRPGRGHPRLVGVEQSV
ncbi:MAG: hypothetical protein R3F30_02245 [Planctomycetota bacterium]